MEPIYYDICFYRRTNDKAQQKISKCHLMLKFTLMFEAKKKKKHQPTEFYYDGII